jgi:acyl-CoA thioesterase I
MITSARGITAVVFPILLGAAGCGGDAPRPPDNVPDRPAGLAPTPATTRTIVFLGTSITAGLGLDPEQAYPALIQQRIDSVGLDFQVINAGVSGETSAGARSRIGWILRQSPAVVVVETGANDGLRGQPPEAVEQNIQAIIDSVRTRSPGTQIVLAGMQALPNLGRDYIRRFVGIYPKLAEKNQVPLIPFILEGVGGVDSLNQPDGIHPTPAGQEVVAANVWKVLQPILKEGP